MEIDEDLSNSPFYIKAVAVDLADSGSRCDSFIWQTLCQKCKNFSQDTTYTGDKDGISTLARKVTSFDFPKKGFVFQG